MWDVPFWAERQAEALFEFEAEALRPYFALDNVLTGERSGRVRKSTEKLFFFLPVDVDDSWPSGGCSLSCDTIRSRAYHSCACVQASSGSFRVCLASP